ncbi:hypothetical protein [Rubritalea tangerina]|uniref:hypothetical protein n=1 Tax=Rubritalea tangerina TaxID=430798 RepID=UPI003619E798
MICDGGKRLSETPTGDTSKDPEYCPNDHKGGMGIFVFIHPPPDVGPQWAKDA